MSNKIIFGDCLEVLKTIESESVTAIIIDPPFNTKKVQKRNRIKVLANENGRGGFGDKKYQVEKIDSTSYQDSFDNFEEFLMPRIKESLRTLAPNGSIFIHLDFREVHYIKVAMDKLMGRDHFMNEIIWMFEWGAKSKKKYSNKHNTILWYVKDPKNYIFNYSDIDRVPYLAPDLVGEKKAAKGKTITAEWWITVVPTHSKEKTNYPTQKPLKLLERLVKMHSNPGNLILDFTAGSGTTGMAAGNLGREFIMIDSNPAAIETMKTRLEKFNPEITASLKEQA
jgi:site-specific DNA-methyltransferase (adenine-specific)